MAWGGCAACPRPPFHTNAYGIPRALVVRTHAGVAVMGFNELELFLQILDLKFKGEIFQARVRHALMHPRHAARLAPCPLTPHSTVPRAASSGTPPHSSRRRAVRHQLIAPRHTTLHCALRHARARPCPTVPDRTAVRIRMKGLYNQYDKVMMEAKEAGDTTANGLWVMAAVGHWAVVGYSSWLTCAPGQAQGRATLSTRCPASPCFPPPPGLPSLATRPR